MGTYVVDADLAMQKKTEVKMLLELANHHATFAVDPVLKTEGVIDLVEEEAMQRFDRRMSENGGYARQQKTYVPGEQGVTNAPIHFVRHYVDFRNWRQDLHLLLQYNGESLVPVSATPGAVRQGGGQLLITVVTERGDRLQMAPKTMIGPSHIMVAYVDEKPFLPILPGHAFPVVSVEEVKF